MAAPFIKSPIKAGIGSQMLRNLAHSVPCILALRELTHNALQSGATKIVWDYCLAIQPGVAKKRIWDNGMGMTPEFMMERLNTLGVEDRTGENMGWGAKISLYRVSPSGVTYISLRDGVASMARFARDQQGDWGAVPPLHSNGPLIVQLSSAQQAALVPDEVISAGHGTVVILHGQDDSDETASSLDPVNKKGTRQPLGIYHYLMSRYMTIPEGVALEVVPFRGGNGGGKRTVTGLEYPLNMYSGQSSQHRVRSELNGDSAVGTMDVQANGYSATIKWWLRDSRTTSSNVPDGQVLIQSKTELYPCGVPSPHVKAGIWEGEKRVTLIIEPGSDVPVFPDPARAVLCLAANKSSAEEKLPVEEWLDCFRRNLPEEISDMLETASASSRTDGVDRLNRRAAKLATVFSFIASRSGSHRGKPDGITSAAGGGSRIKRMAGKSTAAGTSRGPGNQKVKIDRPDKASNYATASDVQELRVSSEPGPVPAKMAPVTLDLPDVVWVTTPGDDLEGRAARFDHADNRLVMNESYTDFQNWLTEWKGKTTPEAAAQVEDKLKFEYSWQILESILSIRQALAGRPGIDEFTTPEALTLAVSRYITIDEKMKHACRNFTRKSK